LRQTQLSDSTSRVFFLFINLLLKQAPIVGGVSIKASTMTELLLKKWLKHNTRLLPITIL